MEIYDYLFIQFSDARSFALFSSNERVHIQVVEEARKLAPKCEIYSSGSYWIISGAKGRNLGIEINHKLLNIFLQLEWEPFAAHSFGALHLRKVVY